jgi:hypothetical protein
LEGKAVLQATVLYCTVDLPLKFSEFRAGEMLPQDWRIYPIGQLYPTDVIEAQARLTNALAFNDIWC